MFLRSFFVPSYEMKKSYILLFDILLYYGIGEIKYGTSNPGPKGQTHPWSIKNRPCNHLITLSRSKTLGVRNRISNTTLKTARL
jgi:hypothetical protein